MNKTVLGVVGVFLLMVSLYVTMFSSWMIDVSFGALSIDGCITQGSNCIDPMVFYHVYLRILAGTLLIIHIVMGIILVIFLRK